jgi:hypothetical protein
MNDHEASEPGTVDPGPPGRRRRALVAATITLMVLGSSRAFWWRHEVTADPGLELSGGLNVTRDERGTDRSGIGPRASFFHSEQDEVAVAFVPSGSLYTTVALHNGGGHDVRIEGYRPGRYFYWGLERVALSGHRDGGVTGFAAPYVPFRPFTLHRDEARELRLEFRIAGCDPAGLQPGGYSGLVALRLRYRILGVTRTADVPFRDTVIALQASGICEHAMTD